MQLHEVDEVKEVFQVAEVNDALKAGWRVVAVVSSVEPHSGSQLPVACYVLGRKFKKDPLGGLKAGDIARANQGL